MERELVGITFPFSGLNVMENAIFLMLLSPIAFEVRKWVGKWPVLCHHQLIGLPH